MDRFSNKDDYLQLELQSVYNKRPSAYQNKQPPPPQTAQVTRQGYTFDPRFSLKSCETEIIHEAMQGDSSIASEPKGKLQFDRAPNNVSPRDQRYYQQSGKNQGFFKRTSKVLPQQQAVFDQSPYYTRNGPTVQTNLKRGSVQFKQSYSVEHIQDRPPSPFRGEVSDQYAIDFDNRLQSILATETKRKRSTPLVDDQYYTPKHASYQRQSSRQFRGSYDQGDRVMNSQRFLVQQTDKNKHLKSIQSTLSSLQQRINSVKSELILKKQQSAQRLSYGMESSSSAQKIVFQPQKSSQFVRPKKQEEIHTIIFPGEKDVILQSKINYSNQSEQSSQKDSVNTTKKQLVSQERLSLWRMVQSQPCPKEARPFDHNPYSPRGHNIYYVSEVIRARNERNSLAKEHVRSSINILRALEDQDLPEPRVQIQLKRHPYYRQKKTIVFDLDQTLVHCMEDTQDVNCDVKMPIKFANSQTVTACINIRPYALTLLNELAQHFELIVFTASHECYANVVVDYLDPQRKIFQHRLFRQHCIKTTGDFYVKDLRIINRNLSDIVLVDNAAYSYAFQLENGIPILPYYEGRNDYQMKALGEYLMRLIPAKDVREVNRKTFKLNHYLKYSSPQELIDELYIESR